MTVVHLVCVCFYLEETVFDIVVDDVYLVPFESGVPQAVGMCL